IEGLANLAFLELHRRFTVRFLVAGIAERVERKRVVLGRGDLFFDQRAEDAGFNRGEREWHEFDDSQGNRRRQIPPVPRVKVTFCGSTGPTDAGSREASR